MSPDKQKLLEDIRSAHYKLELLADSMLCIPGADLDLIDKVKRNIQSSVNCLQLALEAIEDNDTMNVLVAEFYSEQKNPQRLLNRMRSDAMRKLP